MNLIGLPAVIASLRDVGETLDTDSVLDRVASGFAARLSAATPVGFSGRLKSSVVYDPESFEVGYSEGVERLGNPELDSVTRPRTRGRSVVWVKPEELKTIMDETVDAYKPEVISIFEASYGRS
jgi:hypothetical protein